MPAAPDTARAIAVADQAAEALRTLNHLTRHAGILTDPAGAYHLLAALTSLADRLPQLLDQISTRLHTDLPARLRIDALAPTSDPAALLAGVATDLARAGHDAHRLGTSLDQAQQLLSHLAADDTDQPDEKYEMTEQGVSFRPPPGGQFSAAVDRSLLPSGVRAGASTSLSSAELTRYGHLSRSSRARASPYPDSSVHDRRAT